ncbi:MAG TPA: hypothetical protein VI229_00285 [Burkholderiales bacterium]
MKHLRLTLGAKRRARIRFAWPGNKQPVRRKSVQNQRGMPEHMQRWYSDTDDFVNPEPEHPNLWELGFACSLDGEPLGFIGGGCGCGGPEGRHPIIDPEQHRAEVEHFRADVHAEKWKSSYQARAERKARRDADKFRKYRKRGRWRAVESLEADGLSILAFTEDEVPNLESFRTHLYTLARKTGRKFKSKRRRILGEQRLLVWRVE